MWGFFVSFAGLQRPILLSRWVLTPSPALPIRDLDVVAISKEAGCIPMEKSFDRETEDAIDEMVVRIEAERRSTQMRIEALLENFFYDFPAALEENYKHRMTAFQVANLVREHTGEFIESSYLLAVLRTKGYVQVVDKDDFPIKTYWLFG
jgi:hypothetical protein